MLFRNHLRMAFTVKNIARKLKENKPKITHLNDHQASVCRALSLSWPTTLNSGYIQGVIHLSAFMATQNVR